MKKELKVLAPLFLALSLSACGGSVNGTDQEPPKENKEPPAVTMTNVPNTPADKAVLSTYYSGENVHSISVDGLKDLKSCFALAHTAASQSRWSVATVSCLSQGEFVGGYICQGDNSKPPACAATN